MPSFAPDPNQELIAALILEAGRLIENAAPELARGWPSDAGEQYQRITLLADLAETITALSAAATALHSLGESSGTSSFKTITR